MFFCYLERGWKYLKFISDQMHCEDKGTFCVTNYYFLEIHIVNNIIGNNFIFYESPKQTNSAFVYINNIYPLFMARLWKKKKFLCSNGFGLFHENANVEVIFFFNFHLNYLCLLIFDVKIIANSIELFACSNSLKGEMIKYSI